MEAEVQPVADAATTAGSPSDGIESVPRRTTPTWDMELLVSAASVFALFQLAGQIDDLMRWFEPRLGLKWIAFLGMMNVYGKGAVVTLAVTFACHLVLRARWIALVGMNSVYPGGVRWDSIKSAPIQVAIARRRTPPMDLVIERADNLSTIVFALGVGLALGIVVPAVMVVLLYVASVAIGSMLSDDERFLAVFLGLTALVIVPFLLVTLIDRFAGARLDTRRGLGRIVARLASFYARIGFARSSNVLVTLLSSNVGERKATALVFVLMFGVFALASAGPMMRGSGRTLAEWRWLPSDRPGFEREARPVHYADLRERSGDNDSVPYIQSMVVRGPWLRLVIPYDPVRHNEAIGTACPDVPVDEAEKAAEEFARRTALLDCVAGLHLLRLDGNATQVPQLSLHTDGAGGRGFVTMIDVRALPTGRHVLEVARPPIARDARREDALQPYRIEFWR
jgi:hypothetical protein